MIESPERYLADFCAAGADILTVHVETCPHLHRTVQQIKELGCRAGVTLNPATPVVSLEEILPYVDLVLVMTVNPGFGGQRFIEEMLPKIQRVRAMLDGLGSQAELGSGWRDRRQRQRRWWSRRGPDVLVAGSAVFRPAEGDCRAALLRSEDAAQS